VGETECVVVVSDKDSLAAESDEKLWLVVSRSVGDVIESSGSWSESSERLLGFGCSDISSSTIQLFNYSTST
jgi:hypothetical protein